MINLKLMWINLKIDQRICSRENSINNFLIHPVKYLEMRGPSRVKSSFSTQLEQRKPLFVARYKMRINAGFVISDVRRTNNIRDKSAA